MRPSFARLKRRVKAVGCRGLPLPAFFSPFSFADERKGAGRK